MKKYYLHNGTEEIGPFTLEELKLKNVTGNTPIWYEGIDKWTTVSNVAELRGIFETLKPPPYIPPTPPKQPQPVSSPVQQKSKSYTPTIITVIVVLLAFFGVIAFMNNPNSVPGIKFEINTPKPRVLSQSANDAKSDLLKMRETVYASIQNQGGTGTVLITFHLIQDGKTFDRTKAVFFNAGENKDVEATFDEVRRLGGDMQFSVDARPE